MTQTIEDAEDINIVGVRVTLTYSEDETSSGIGCNAPGLHRIQIPSLLQWHTMK